MKDKAYAQDLTEVIRRIAERGIAYSFDGPFNEDKRSSLVDLFQHILDETTRLQGALKDG